MQKQHAFQHKLLSDKHIILYIIFKCCKNLATILYDLQDLQRDIEKHSTGVASVLNLCEVLLHDCDACSTETECDSIQQATRGLDRRWRNICAMSMERRLKSVPLPLKKKSYLIYYIHMQT